MDSWKGTPKPAATCNKPMTGQAKPAQAAGTKTTPTAKKPTGKK
jgi:hypothetical protein